MVPIRDGYPSVLMDALRYDGLPWVPFHENQISKKENNNSDIEDKAIGNGKLDIAVLMDEVRYDGLP